MQDNPYHAEFLLKRLMEKTTDSIYFKDLNSRFVLVNSMLAESWGYASPEELIGKSDADSFQAEDAQQMSDDEREIMRTGISLEGLEEETTWKDGHVAWSSTSKMPLIDERGNMVGTFGISRNITGHKLAELKIEQYAEEMRRIKEGMEEELRMAAELQKSFLPHDYPEFPSRVSPSDSMVEFIHRFQPDGMVSGDICAIRKLSDSEAGILICDVMGHGVRAALGTALIHASLDEFSLKNTCPARFLEELNRRLFPVLRTEDVFIFSTACYVILNVYTGAVRLANAGHPLPLVLRDGRGGIQWAMQEEHRGPALAIEEEPAYIPVTLQLEKDEGMLLFTDGLYEVENAAGEELGEAALRDAVEKCSRRSLNEFSDELIQAVKAHSDDGTFNDDLCLVGFKRLRSD